MQSHGISSLIHHSLGQLDAIRVAGSPSRRINHHLSLVHVDGTVKDPVEISTMILENVEIQRPTTLFNSI